jgi:dihydrofolate synthase / folylpolyglutamate synthase
MAARTEGLIALDRADRPGRFDSLGAWLRWLEAGRGAHIELGLERCREVAANLNLGQPAPTVITVAGTNGKGSSVALLESIWRSAGYRVGTYTSPHLVRYNERIRVDGAEIPDAAICAAFESVESARGRVPLTYFEFATLAALEIFEQSRLDIAILEVGLGGRLDAVNIVDPDVALIAAIGLDHEDWLGSSREEIALEKAGIMRSGRPVICSDNDAPEAIFTRAEAIGAELDLLGVSYAFEDDETSWSWWSGPTVSSRLPLPALAGKHQLRNAAGVLKVIDVMQHRHAVSPSNIHDGLNDVVLPGRFHRVLGAFEYVMDVAHNPQAAEAFVATLGTMPPSRRTHALIGMLNTKNHVEYLRRLAPVADIWHFASLPGSTGARAEDLRAGFNQLDRRCDCECYATIDDAHTSIIGIANPGDRILILGSFLTVGAVMKILHPEPESAG